ncbi:MAG: MaoC family dehydratase [Alphaproteobacteria bacterium]
MPNELYYEDFEVGQKFESGTYVMDRQDIIDFAREYDPQPQHIDEEGAKASLFGTLVASGWHTAAASMRLKIESPMSRVAGGLVGMGLEEVKWPRPVYPGDELHVVVTVLEKRESKSKPGKGVIRYKVETFNQKDELVMEMRTAVIVPLRGA